MTTTMRPRNRYTKFIPNGLAVEWTLYEVKHRDDNGRLLETGYIVMECNGTQVYEGADHAMAFEALFGAILKLQDQIVEALPDYDKHNH